MMSPDEERIGWLSLSIMWFGGMVSVPALIIGSALVAGLPFLEMCMASAIGFSLLAMLMCLQSVTAVNLRRDTVAIAACAFGSNGANFVVGLTVGISLVGWFGVQTQIASDALVKIAHQSFQVGVKPAQTAIVLGLLMVSVAVSGFKYMRWLNYVAVPCKVALVAYAVIVAVRGSSMEAVLAYQPSPAGHMDFLTAVGLAIGAFAVGAVIAPDYAQHCKSRSAAVIGTVVGIVPAAMGMAVCGSILSIVMGTHDIVEIYAKTGMPMLALSILVIAAWTTNVMNAYSAGLALTRLANRPASWRPAMTLVAGAGGAALAAMGVMTNFVSFLTVLTITVPPIAGVLVAAHWFVPLPANGADRAFRWQGLAAWILAAAVAWLIDHPVRNLVGVFAGGLLYAVLSRFTVLRGSGLNAAGNR